MHGRIFYSSESGGHDMARFLKARVTIGPASMFGAAHRNDRFRFSSAFAPLSLEIPEVLINFIHIDRVFHPTDLRKDWECESLYRHH